MASDREKIEASLPNHVDVFTYDQHDKIIGLNYENGLIGFSQNLRNVNHVLIGICTMFDYDRTRAGDDNRDTQGRIAALITEEVDRVEE